jgi:hypothetical protein
MTPNFFSPLSFVAVFGSGIRDPGDPGSEMGKNQDPGSGINIPDPQHCSQPYPNLQAKLLDRVSCTVYRHSNESGLALG